uniref:Uncharacterized protein n=1 Tax=Proboscia inermis TaxID=420281 RepID=A0A7S0C0Z0_9STRA
MSFNNSYHNTCLKYPEQGEETVQKEKKGLKEDIEEIHDKVQRHTLRMFDDRIYVCRSIEDDIGTAIPQSTNTASPSEHSVRSGAHNNAYIQKIKRVAATKVTKSLRMKSKMSINNTISFFFGPLISVLEIFLAMLRSCYNLFAWKDPYLSFWFVLVLVLFRVISEFFPWQIFFGLLGAYLIGPQNYFLRLWRENKSKNVSEGPSAKLKLTTQKVTNYLAGIKSERSFQGHHRYPDRQPSTETRNNKDHITHEVFVPYSVLRRNRFFDWPPEPTASSVRIKSD